MHAEHAGGCYWAIGKKESKQVKKYYCNQTLHLTACSALLSVWIANRFQGGGRGAESIE